jgi:hypothetical protein
VLEERYTFGDGNLPQADLFTHGATAQGHLASHTRVLDCVRFAEHRDPVPAAGSFHQLDRVRVHPAGRPATHRDKPNALWSHPCPHQASQQPVSDPLSQRVPVFLADAGIVTPIRTLS